MVPGREGTGHEHRRKSCCCELPDGAARPRESDIRRAVRHPDLVDERLQDVVGTRDAVAQLGVVALAAKVDDGWPGLGPRVERQLVEETRAERAPEDEHDRPVRR